MRQLPPFLELVAFEAVARHRSFTRAADELCLTQSAVSHRVRRFERFFGTQLLRRLNPGIALTDAGAALLPEIIAALDSLADLSGRASGHRERKLRVAAGGSLCTWWLAGRLSSFMKARPGVSIELIPIKNDEASTAEADIRILWVGEGDDGRSATQAPLFNEQVFPVCSPTLLPKERPLRHARELGSLPLLHKLAHGAGEWTWKVWFDRLDVERKSRSSELRFEDLSLALSAAVDGAGVALARSLLAHDALRDGRLIVPIPGVEPMRSTKKHIARWRRSNADDPDVAAFIGWLTSEAQVTLNAVEGMLRGRQPEKRKRA